MANIENGQAMANNKGELFTIIKVDEKAKTATLKSLETGSTRVYSFTTLKDKRRFTFTESVEEEVEEVTPAESTEDVIPEDNNLVPMPGAEKLADLKEEVEKESRKPRITITYKGVTKSPKEWAEEFNLSPKYIRLQLRKGKSPEQIFGDK